MVESDPQLDVVESEPDVVVSAAQKRDRTAYQQRKYQERKRAAAAALKAATAGKRGDAALGSIYPVGLSASEANQETA